MGHVSNFFLFCQLVQSLQPPHHSIWTVLCVLEGHKFGSKWESGGAFGAFFEEDRQLLERVEH